MVSLSFIFGGFKMRTRNGLVALGLVFIFRVSALGRPADEPFPMPGKTKSYDCAQPDGLLLHPDDGSPCPKLPEGVDQVLVMEEIAYTEGGLDSLVGAHGYEVVRQAVENEFNFIVYAHNLYPEDVEYARRLDTLRGVFVKLMEYTYFHFGHCLELTKKSQENSLKAGGPSSSPMYER